MACRYEAWESVKNGRWYWHLVDRYEAIVAEGGGGYGHDDLSACVVEMNKMEECVQAGNRHLPVDQIPDPNA